MRAGVTTLSRTTLSPTTILALVIVLGEWTGLARALVRAPVYAAGLDVVLVGLFAFTVWRAWQVRQSVRFHLLDGLLAAYFLLALVEIFNPNVPSPLVGLEGFRKTAFMMLAYPIVRFSTTRDSARFFRIVVIGSIAAFLWSIRQAMSPLPIELDIMNTSGTSPLSFRSGPVLRAFAPTPGPFHLGILGAAVAVVATVLARTRDVRYVGVAVVAAVALGLTLTRANILAAVAAFGAVVLASPPMAERIRSALRFAPVALALGLAVFFTARSVVPTTAPAEPQGAGAIPSAAISSLGPVPQDALPNPLDDRSLRFRFEYWSEGLQAIAERPLVGYGTSSAGDGFGRLYQGTGDRNFNPHSLYLKAALELGLVGLALILAILAVALRECRRAFARNTEVALIGLGLLVLTTMSGFSGPMLDAYPFNLLFWATVGWLVAVQAGPRQPSGASVRDEEGFVLGGDAIP
ncbi:MAG: O-antigen ligase family protein [Chloroflexi bacterium]|nr:O-antigen ligase family protein [Chloroflexota bacterium]